MEDCRQMCKVVKRVLEKTGRGFCQTLNHAPVLFALDFEL